jgi:transcriptional regulator with XRE-family HTH domain
MIADPQASPAVARRRVRFALRRARQKTGLSQGDVADRLGWSVSKVQRIEAGEVSVSGTDVRALADLYQAFTADELEQLVADTRIARRQRWWTAPEYRQHLTSGLVELLGFESEAVQIRAYQPVLVPGVLQTADTATFILDYWNDALSEKDRRIRHEVRQMRRGQVIEREDAPAYYLVLDESVLRRDIGGAKVAAEQMETLVEAASRPDVHIRVVPLDRGGMLGLLGPFSIVYLDEENPADAVLYRESWNSDVIVHNARELQSHRGYFDVLWEQSLSEDVTLRLIKAQAARLRSTLDRING